MKKGVSIRSASWSTLSVLCLVAALVTCGPSGQEDFDAGGQTGDDGGQVGSDALAEVCWVSVNLDPIIPSVILLIDQSGSMDDPFGSTTRWQAMRDALVDPAQGVVARLSTKVVFGMTLYTSHSGDAGGTCPILQRSPPALDNYADIYTLLWSNEPDHDTPTGNAVEAVLEDFPPTAPDSPASPRILVLVTDGEPDTCADPDSHGQPARDLSESAVQAAYSENIQTFVLSVGDAIAQSHLQRLANAGVGEPLDSGTAPYYVANDPTDLVDAFDDIIDGQRSCEFLLNGVVNLAEAAGAEVDLNGQSLVYGVDWRMVDNRTMELLGTACDTFLSELSVTFDAQFPCDAIVL